MLLTFEQRRLVHLALQEFATRFEWTLHSCAVQTNHVHAVITAPREGTALREAMKAGASRELNAKYGKRRWWAEGGSSKYLWEPDYLQNALAYVKRQCDF